MQPPLRIAAVCIGSCLAHAAPISAAWPQSPATAVQVAASEARIRIATVAIDAAAARLFHDAGERYTSPHIVGYQESINSACGQMEPNNAHACRLDASIYYDRVFIAELMTRAAAKSGSDGSMAVIFPIAHEWGHELQFMMGLDYAKFNTSEHDADCLAGVLIAASRNGVSLSSRDLADAEYTMEFLGDPPLSTGAWGAVLDQMNAERGNRGGFSNAIGNHGNSAERMTAFRDGLRSGLGYCVRNVPRFGRRVVQSQTAVRPPVVVPLVINWFVDKTGDAYDLGVAQHKPIVLVTGDFNAVYFKRLKNEVLGSPELAQLAPYAIFVYADPNHDLVAKNFGKALGYDKWPEISLLAPNGNLLDEQARIVGFFDAQTVTTVLSKKMRANGWLPSTNNALPANPPWMPPRPTVPQ
jgi:predicted metalloprotease